MKYRSLFALWLTIVLVFFSVAHAADDGLESEQDKVFYYLGTPLSGNLRSLNLTFEVDVNRGRELIAAR